MVNPMAIIGVLSTAIVFGFLFGLFYKDRLIARSFAISACLLGNMAAVIQSLFIHEHRPEFLAHLTAWTAMCYFLIHGSLSRYRFKKTLEINIPIVFVKFPFLKRL